MDLPIAKILWAPTNAAHQNHLHVEGDPRFNQSQMPTNGIWTPAIRAIVDALDARYGEGEHFIIDPDAGWTHMGVYNPRYIAGTTIWSQHAGANAIDIGPYYGVSEQQEFYDFLTGKEEDMPLSDSDIERIVAAIQTIDMPDQDDGVGRRGWTHGVKQAWGNSNKILALLQNGAGGGGEGVSAAQVRAIVQEELAKLTLKSS